MLIRAKIVPNLVEPLSKFVTTNAFFSNFSGGLSYIRLGMNDKVIKLKIKGTTNGAVDLQSYLGTLWLLANWRAIQFSPSLCQATD